MIRFGIALNPPMNEEKQIIVRTSQEFLANSAPIQRVNICLEKMQIKNDMGKIIAMNILELFKNNVLISASLFAALNCDENGKIADIELLAIPPIAPTSFEGTV